MSDNKKVLPKKGFFKRNSFLLIFFGLLIVVVAFLYSNNNLNINSIIQKPETKEDPVIIQPENNNKELETKVANLEKLIQELSKNIKNAQSQKSETQVVQPQQNIIEIKDLDAYELLKGMNMILLNIDNQQVRNNNVTKLQSQFMFFSKKRLQSLLNLPDTSFSKNELLVNEKKYMEHNFMNGTKLPWLKKIIKNIFEISISREIENPIGAFITSIENSNYSGAVVSYNNLTQKQKQFFQTSYNIAKSYEEQRAYLENLF
ncbi:MAG: hypothetical protein CMI90_05190 [Pelagibacteraceae bacterium]|nr:hypothetical protein [Pelagibacteraceae bacterium]|tara:strand:- start:275 stop:1054 length:780 start_codon:yes stop_codon:yes gene_type:complete